jgi:hypothetical protein
MIFSVSVKHSIDSRKKIHYYTDYKYLNTINKGKHYEGLLTRPS